jgi:CHAD domain-containing protein
VIRSKDASLHAALTTLLRERHARFADEFAHAVRGASEERVHQSRVAARSLRSIVGTLGRAVDAPLAASIQRDLRAFGLELGSLREADVRRDWLIGLAGEAGLPRDRMQRLKRALARDRAAARRSFREHAHGIASRERLDRLATAFADPRLVEARADLRPFLASRLERRWKRLLAALEVRSPDALELHEVRLSAKHARYAIEALVPLLGGDPSPVVKPLRRLQACLGDHHDAFDALSWLERRTRPPGPDLLARLRGPIERRMKKRLRAFRELRRQLRQPKSYKALRVATHPGE